MATTLLANQDPTHLHIPDDAVFTIADEIADLMVAVGYQADSAERTALHALYPQRRNGDWYGLDSGIVCPRQNLKTSLMLGGALHDSFVQGVKRVMWTAHEFKTSAAAFLELRSIIESHSWLESEVLRIHTANGKEGFELRNGSRLNIIARSDKSGRGMSAERLYLDEALYLRAKMMGALVPTMSAMRNAHMVYGSSPGTEASEVLRGARDRGRAGLMSWIEWANERKPCASPECSHRVGVAGCWFDDMDAVIRVNPAYPRRISLEYLRNERRSLERVPTEYLRERMGVWEDPVTVADEQVLPADEWAACASSTSTVPDGARIAFFVDTSWDRQRSWIAAVGTNADGIPHGEIVAVNAGTDWVIGWLRERVGKFATAAIGLQANGAPASSLVDPMLEAFGNVNDGGLISAMSGSDLGSACGQLYDAVKVGSMVYRPQEQLAEAVKRAAIRALGDSWLWDRKKSPVDVAPLMALTGALSLWLTAPDTSPSVYETRGLIVL